GGWHLVVASRLYGLDPEGLQISYEMHRAEDGMPVHLPSVYMLRPERVTRVDDHLLRLYDLCVFGIVRPADVVDMVVDLRLTAMPLAGEAVSDVRRIRVTDDDGV